jgi:hypothetical protein
MLDQLKQIEQTMAMERLESLSKGDAESDDD